MRLGADPEVFLKNKQGKHISAIGLVNAGKWDPLQMPGMRDGFTIQEDNVALEFGIPPAASAEEFFNHINSVLNEAKKWTQGLSFSGLACTIFDADQMEHPAAHVFGCEPDFCAWTSGENKKPEPPHQYMRSAGGHIHVETDQDPEDVVKRMDFFLGIPSVMMDKDVGRKQLYGKWGAHRRKPYGVEYRVLGNFWTAPEGTEEERKKLCNWVWSQTARALASKQDMNELREYIDIAINQNDKHMADALINEYGLTVV